MLHGQFVQCPPIVFCGLERQADIGKGKRDPTASRPRTRNFHDWKKLLQLPIREPAKVDGQMSERKCCRHIRPSDVCFGSGWSSAKAASTAVIEIADRARLSSRKKAQPDPK